MARQWYARYMGDYGRDTAHLSLSEHGAYALLLDLYYSSGKALPADRAALYRICRALGDGDQRAVDSVLGQFFQLHGDGYHNPRADAELIRQAERTERLSSSGRRGAAKRWQRPRSAQAPDGQANGVANGPTMTNPQPQPQPRPQPERAAATAAEAPAAPGTTASGGDPSLAFQGQHLKITMEQHAKLQDTYPSLNVAGHYPKMDLYLDTHRDDPKGKRKNCYAFARNWLAREKAQPTLDDIAPIPPEVLEQFR